MVNAILRMTFEPVFAFRVCELFLLKITGKKCAFRTILLDDKTKKKTKCRMIWINNDDNKRVEQKQRIRMRNKKNAYHWKKMWLK